MTDPIRIGLVGVEVLGFQRELVVDEAEDAGDLAPVIPIDGTNCRIWISTSPSGEPIGFQLGECVGAGDNRRLDMGHDLPRFGAHVEVKPLLLLV